MRRCSSSRLLPVRRLAGVRPARHRRAPCAASQDAAPLMPRYLLMDVQGRAVTQEDFRGRFQLVSFGFISCPDVCPTTLLEVKQVLDALGDKASRCSRSSSPSILSATRARCCATTRRPSTRASSASPARPN
jgi:hypothetical protein